jgi:hypothetical protein
MEGGRKITPMKLYHGANGKTSANYRYLFILSFGAKLWFLEFCTNFFCTFAIAFD